MLSLITRLRDSALYITSKLIDSEEGDFETRAFITNNDIMYQIPIIVRVSEAITILSESENELSFQVNVH